MAFTPGTETWHWLRYLRKQDPFREPSQGYLSTQSQSFGLSRLLNAFHQCLGKQNLGFLLPFQDLALGINSHIQKLLGHLPSFPLVYLLNMYTHMLTLGTVLEIPR